MDREYVVRELLVAAKEIRGLLVDESDPPDVVADKALDQLKKNGIKVGQRLKKFIISLAKRGDTLREVMSEFGYRVMMAGDDDGVDLN